MDLTAEQINEHIDKFTDIYKDGKEIHPMPNNVKITVWCESDSECGFAYNTTTDDMGLEAFIAKKWILQDDLMCAVANDDTGERQLTIPDVSGSIKCTCCDRSFKDEDSLMAHLYNRSL